MAVAARVRTSSLRALAVSRRPPLRSIHEGPDTIDELLDRHLSKKPPTSSAALLDDDATEAEARRRLTSSRREALGLYRDILRATRLFAWPDERGVSWREVLRANARREFEEARGERDPEVVARLLIGGQIATYPIHRPRPLVDASMVGMVTSATTIDAIPAVVLPARNLVSAQACEFM